MEGSIFPKALVCAAVAASFASGNALAADSALYLGVNAGRTEIDTSIEEIERGFAIDDDFVATSTTIDDTDNGWKAYIGIQFNPYFAIEGGYVDLGEATFNTTITDAPAPVDLLTPFPIRGTAEADGFNLVGVLFLPMDDGLSAFLKAGGFRWNAEFREVIPDTGATRVSRSAEDTDRTYGAGLRFGYADGLQVRLEWERFENIGKGIGGREGRDVDLVSIGLTVGF